MVSPKKIITVRRVPVTTLHCGKVRVSVKPSSLEFIHPRENKYGVPKKVITVRRGTCNYTPLWKGAGFSETVVFGIHSSKGK